MREILFRGQTRRKGQKVWMDGTPVDSNWVEGYGVCMGKGDFSVIYAGDHVEKFTVYTDTVGQFTGLTDKNGKKIFEGDIFKVTWQVDGRMPTHDCYVAEFRNGYFAARKYNSNNIVGSIANFTNRRAIGNTGVFVEVIGNIHDNPELLGGAEDGKTD